MGIFFKPLKGHQVQRVYLAFCQSKFFLSNRENNFAEINMFTKNILAKPFLGDVFITNLQKNVMSIIDTMDMSESWITKAGKFISSSYNDKTIRLYTSRMEADDSDLFNIFLYMLIGTMPNPFIKLSFAPMTTMLDPLFMYMEPEKIFPQLIKITLSNGLLQSSSDREKILLTSAVALAQEIKSQHEAVYGVAWP